MSDFELDVLVATRPSFGAFCDVYYDRHPERKRMVFRLTLANPPLLLRGDVLVTVDENDRVVAWRRYE